MLISVYLLLGHMGHHTFTLSNDCIFGLLFTKTYLKRNLRQQTITQDKQHNTNNTKRDQHAKA